EGAPKPEIAWICWGQKILRKVRTLGCGMWDKRVGALTLTRAVRYRDAAFQAQSDERLTVAAFLDSWLARKEPRIRNPGSGAHLMPPVFAQVSAICFLEGIQLTVERPVAYAYPAQRCIRAAHERGATTASA